MAVDVLLIFLVLKVDFLHGVCIVFTIDLRLLQRIFDSVARRMEQNSWRFRTLVSRFKILYTYIYNHVRVRYSISVVRASVTYI